MTRIYDLYKYDKSIKSVKCYIDNTIKDVFDKLNLDVITFNKRVYNQYKYAIIFTYKAIKARWAYTFKDKGDTKKAIKKINILI